MVKIVSNNFMFVQTTIKWNFAEISRNHHWLMVVIVIVIIIIIIIITIIPIVDGSEIPANSPLEHWYRLISLFGVEAWRSPSDEVTFFRTFSQTRSWKRCHPQSGQNHLLGGGWCPTHLKNMRKWSRTSSPIRGENKTYGKPPPSIEICTFHFRKVWVIISN